MAREQFTEAELSMLSETERAALLDEDDQDDATDATDSTDDTATDTAGSDAADDTDDEDDGDDDAAEDTGAAADASVEDQAAAAEAVEAAAAGQDTAAQAGPSDDEVDYGDGYVSLLKVNGNGEQLKGDITAAEQERADLKSKYDAGELDQDEYMNKRESLTEKLGDLKSKLSIEENAVEQNQHALAQRWQYEQDQFFNSATGKAIAGNPLLLSAFDTAVKTLGSDEKNNTQAGPWFLKEAAKQVREMAPGSFPATAADKPAEKPTPKPTKAGEKPNLSNIPNTLASMPAADDDDASAEDEFAWLDKLTGTQYEDALAKLESSDPAKHERYLRG